METKTALVRKDNKPHNVVEYPQVKTVEEAVEALGEAKVVELVNRMLGVDAQNWARGIATKEEVCKYAPTGNVRATGDEAAAFLKARGL